MARQFSSGKNQSGNESGRFPKGGSGHPDLFLSEEALIAMAIRELKGKRPPRQGEKSPYATQPGSPIFATAPSKLKQELEARGWVIRDLAKALRVSESEAAALANGKMRISSDIAEKLGMIFATSKEFWE